MNETLTIEETWEKLRDFALDDPQSDRPFSVRLREENGWSAEYAARVIEEYRRFLFLGVTCPHPVTPSDPVDQVWHLHLLYTKSYWIDLCQETLGRPFHHGPSKGGINEDRKYGDLYLRTLESYTHHFGPPPADLWPTGPQPETQYQRVDLVALERQFRQKSFVILALAFLSGAGLSSAFFLCL